MMDDLRIRESYRGQVERGTNGIGKLYIGKTDSEHYSLVQLDNYMHLPRRSFPCQPPLHLSLKARISGTDLPGTWGFGLWNDPLSFSFGGGGMAKFLPVLPNAAWFFYGSSENLLSLRDDLLGTGFFERIFSSPLLPSVFSLFSSPFLPFLLLPVTAPILRRITRRIFREDARAISPPVEEWHQFGLDWERNQVIFSVDRTVVFSTPVIPAGKLCLVIWIDNQYMRFYGTGKLAFGFQQIKDAQILSIAQLQIF